MTNDELIQSLVDLGALRTPKIIDAFRQVDRQRFVPPTEMARAYDDIPLPLGYGATISQPYTVAIMIELLQPQPGERCLDVGAGSGWTAALLATLVGIEGSVIAIERLPQLQPMATAGLQYFALPQLSYRIGDASQGFVAAAPYDVIHVAAATARIPAALPAQLALGGRCVLPVGTNVQDLVLLTKMSDNTTTERRIPGFQFVPLIPQSPYSS